jgi:hypothetical protein
MQMPIRRVNFTGRKRISGQHVVISLRRSEPNEAVQFDASIDLATYQVPADALVSVEAYRQTSRVQYPFGTVASITPPSDRSLASFDSPEAVLFRVRVTDVGKRHGLLLAEADRIRPRYGEDEDSNRIPLLPPAPGDLGDQVWRVELEGKPILRLNRNLIDWKEAVKSDQFRALVYPAAVREVLRRVLLDGVRNTEDLGDWRGQWLLFASKVPGVPPVPAKTEDDEEWIDEAVSAFSRNFGMLKRYQRDFFGSRSE